jgi:glycogen operon protein
MTAGEEIETGRPYPLGATWDGGGTNFALFSAHADAVELCLFSAKGREVRRLPLPAWTDEVWHGYLPGIGPGQLYGYRVHGPYAPDQGHRFNPAKLLLDPYAKALAGSLRWRDALMGYRVGSNRADLSQDRRDSAFAMPKAVVIDPTFSWGDDRRPDRPLADTVVYEAHVRGMTMRHPGIPMAERGSFAAMASPPVLEHLTRLGITAVELLPVQAFFDEPHLIEQGLSNYWGYNSIGFFAPEPRYLGQGVIWEFQAMVRRFHTAGIEVILDVVYNHTAEGSELGPTLSFRGIDNASYYRLLPDNPRHYINDTGCGNTLNLSHPRVLQMVMDSLRYWVEVMHVDGFRFDLASTLAREDHGFDPGSGFLDAIRQDPVLSQVKLIAEPWDVGPGGYRLGGFPPGFSEWNDRYRDGIRRFWRGDDGMLPDLARGLLGSSELFEHRGRRTQSSINYVTSHDGFNLGDLVTYNQKHNEANGEGNRDGHDANHSWNHGIEGPTDDPAILAMRDRQKRNMLASMLLSQGTPMLLAGDEIGHSQGGNNNAYCQDNDTTWLDWENADTALAGFVADLIALRCRHPILRQSRFLHGLQVSEDGSKDVTWVNPDGEEKTGEDWQNGWARTIGLMLHEPVAGGDSLLILFNAHHEEVAFTLPQIPGDGRHWHEFLNTLASEADRDRGTAWPVGEPFALTGRSLSVFGPHECP